MMLQIKNNKLPKTILKYFNDYFLLLENADFPNNKITKKTTDSAFRLAWYIEKTTSKIGEDEYISFENMLKSQLFKDENKIIYFVKSDLKNACDKILEKYFKNLSSTSEIVNMGIISYIVLCGQERLQVVLSSNILSAESCQAIHSFIKDNLNNTQPLQFMSELLMSQYLELCKKGQIEGVKESINKVFEGDSEENINILINILLSKYQSKVRLSTKEINAHILMNLISKTNNSQNNILWDILIANINRLKSLCLIYPRILLQVAHFFVTYKENSIGQEDNPSLDILQFEIVDAAIQSFTEDIHINNCITYLLSLNNHIYTTDLHVIKKYKD